MNCPLQSNNLNQKISFLIFIVVPDRPDCLLSQEEQAVLLEAPLSPPPEMPSGQLAPLSGLCFTSGHKVNVCLVCWVAPNHHITTESQKP